MMNLAIVKDNDELEIVTEGIDEYNLSKQFAASEIIYDIQQVLRYIRESEGD